MQFDELGFYTLAGAPNSPRELIDEVQQAEALGIGTAFISERFNIKEAATLSGAAGAVTDSIRIATAATNHTSRHPIITASYATTMHRLTNGRFSLGLGRGIDPLMAAYGIPKITTASMEQFAALMRRLWAGEAVFDYADAQRAYPVLHLDASFQEDIPLTLVAFGPETLALGGRAFDAVVLHTFFTDETTSAAVRAVKTAAEQAGRDPDAVQVWSCFATVGDHIESSLRLRKTVGRLATYLQGYGDLLVRTNRWDPAVLTRFRANELVASFPGAIDGKATTQQLEEIATLIPEEWLASAATGSPSQCVSAIRHQFSLGCDRVILHGATPTELTPIIEEYAKHAR
jgi:probable F420-dependent oxidoreductase